MPPPEGTPNQFACFERSDEVVFIRKVSLVWWLSNKKKRVSPDRSYRFINSRASPDDDVLQLGDYATMMFKNQERMVQVLAFRFASGKKFYGSHYDPKRETGAEVECLCNFLEWNQNRVVKSNFLQRYINVKSYKNHITLKRDHSTGSLIRR